MPLPILDEEYVLSNELCSYGCGMSAKYAYKNGNFCCSGSSNQCSFVKINNGKSICRAHKDGKFDKIDRKSSAGKISMSVKEFHHKKNQNVEFGDLSDGFKRKRILTEQNGVCLWCLNSEWLDKKLCLELDHINGNNMDNTRGNLRLLCPNCHSLTPTWRRMKGN